MQPGEELLVLSETGETLLSGTVEIEGKVNTMASTGYGPVEPGTKCVFVDGESK
jgi:hypothetical protein